MEGAICDLSTKIDDGFQTVTEQRNDAALDSDKWLARVFAKIATQLLKKTVSFELSSSLDYLELLMDKGGLCVTAASLSLNNDIVMADRLTGSSSMAMSQAQRTSTQPNDL
jgi:hypothetical protein